MEIMNDINIWKAESGGNQYPASPVHPSAICAFFYRSTVQPSAVVTRLCGDHPKVTFQVEDSFLECS